MSDAATRAYSNVLQFIRETPWAVLPESFATVRDVIGAHLEGWRPTEKDVAELEAMAARRPAAYASGAIAVLPLQGMIMPKASMFSAISGGTSLDSFCQMLSDAVNDPSVSHIVLDVDSPGGSCDMVVETAAAIRAAAAQKPIVAVANTMAASAAYHLASQATELSVTPSGEVGSIGVFAAHQDRSQMQALLGVKTTLIKAGKYKTEGNPFEPLSEDARQAIQARVDDLYSMFVADVAKGRRTSPDAVTEGFGQGRMVAAQDAVQAGMADRVETLQQAITRIARGNAAAAGGRRASLGEPAATEVRETEGLPLNVDEPEAAVATGDTPSPAPLVPGAEGLLARSSFREAFIDRALKPERS
jgi:signal peptide peptidase SppA